MNKTVLKELKAHIKQLLKEEIIKKDGVISIREDNLMWITTKNSDLTTIGEDSFTEIDLINLTPTKKGKLPASEFLIHAAIYNKQSFTKAIIHSTQESVLCASKAGKTIYPTLDDMAQIAGTCVKVSDVPNVLSNDEAKKMLAKLKGKNAIFLSKRGILCCSASLYDAHAVAMVMEKACKSVIEATFLGKAIRINPIEAALMRFVYQKKYSKKAHASK